MSFNVFDERKLLKSYFVYFTLTLKDEKSSNSENDEYLNDAYSIQPTMDFCSDYVNFLAEEERNETVIQNEAKEVKIFF